MDSQKNTYLAVWATITVLLTIFFVYVYKPSSGEEISFWLRLVTIVISIPLAFVGFMVGDFVRRLTIPDMIFTTGGMLSILKEKLFWFCVPQLVGIVVGVAVGASMMLPK